VRKVMVAAHELGLADRIRTVRTVVAMSSVNRELLAENPLGKIPTLVLEDGTILYDSQVILEYLDSLAGGGRLIPPPGPARWQELRRHALATGLLEQLILWMSERGRKPPSQAMLDAFALKVGSALDALEAEIGAIAAAPLGIAQVTLGVVGDYLDFRFSDIGWRARCPKLSAWQQAFSQRASMLANPVTEG
jgi:glutathione S-transferase